MAPPKLRVVTVDDPPEGRDPNDSAGTAARERSRLGVPEAALATLEVQKASHEALEADRMAEAILFAAGGPVDASAIASQLPAGTDIGAVLVRLQNDYAGRGVNLVRTAGKWAFRTAEDLSWLLEKHTTEERKLSRAALEMLAIIAYHQPVTRSEVEEIRGVITSKGTLDVLLETGWVRPRGRRRAPGRPLTYGTTEAFLAHFSLDAIKDLPGLAELKGAGLLDGNLPPGFKVPEPTDVAALMPDELPLDGDDDEDGCDSEGGNSSAPDLFHDDDEFDSSADRDGSLSSAKIDDVGGDGDPS